MDAIRSTVLETWMTEHGYSSNSPAPDHDGHEQIAEPVGIVAGALSYRRQVVPADQAVSARPARAFLTGIWNVPGPVRLQPWTPGLGTKSHPVLTAPGMGVDESS
ncbi:hypothetical protein OH809_24745 [Streptomyces sp. NBC_00873]|nr:hypothetical protein OH809_24745 [Streptomyces sp. NBC_00873]WTA44375.1 hypothetical protein OH821_18545 [Streptomyces sp. NBC_00842]